MDCKTCGAMWDKDELLVPGKLANACCQECGYDARVHGDHKRIGTAEDFGLEPAWDRML